MDESPNRSSGLLAGLAEVLSQPALPVLFAGLLLLEGLVALPATGRCRCGSRSWPGMAIMTDAGPRVIAYPSAEWDQAEESGATTAPLATARVFRLRSGGLGPTTLTGISLVYSATPGSGWDTPLMERAFREQLADAFERENVTGEKDTAERLRSGVFSSQSINVSGIVQLLFIATPPVGLALTTPLAIRASATRRAQRKGFCAHCGYDARGLSTCPECGNASTVNNEA